jgi:hypothetical protein
MIKIQAIGIKDEGKPYRVVNAKLFRQELDSLPKGRYRHTVEKYRKAKSNPQLGYLFACVYPLSMKLLNDAGWEITSIDQTDAFWKDLYAKKEVINRHTGEIRMIPALKRDFLTTDMMNYIEAIRQHCSEYLGGYIPGPEENMKIEFEQ